MRTIHTRSFLTVWMLGLIIIIGVGSSAFGQGRGHGGDKGDKGDKANRGQSGERGEGRQHADNPGQQKRQDRQEQRQEQRQDRGDQGNQDRNKHDNRPNPVIIEQQPDYRVERGQGNGKWKQKDHRDERNVYPVYPQQQNVPQWNNALPYNYGQQRSAEVHARNAERKALREQSRMYGGYYNDRVYSEDRNNYDPRYSYNQGYSYDPRNTYQQRDSLRSNILRSVIGMVLGNNNASQYATPQYNNYSYGVPYNPAYNGGGYYDPYSQYQGYNTTPYYNGYQQIAYPYSSNYGISPGFSNGVGSQIVLPLLTNLLASRGGFIGRLASQLLASGYNQGYTDAQYARSNGYNNQYYQDPYAYESAYSDRGYSYQDIGYDPYSSLDQNRQYLSEGYQLGYRDALNSRNQPLALNNVGGGDLISLLLGNVLRVN